MLAMRQLNGMSLWERTQLEQSHGSRVAPRRTAATHRAQPSKQLHHAQRLVGRQRGRAPAAAAAAAAFARRRHKLPPQHAGVIAVPIPIAVLARFERLW